MMNVKDHKIFLMAKGGLSVSRSADSISADEKLQRFAIADGVTQSYFPQFFSNALTKGFIERADSATHFFDAPEIAETFNKVVCEWNSKVIEAEQNADKLNKRLYEERKFGNPLGATTFAGVTLENDHIEIICIGDSCVFIIPDDKELSPLMVTSMPHSTNDESHQLLFDCKFGSRPHVINTKGYLSTTPVTESASPGACWLLMMTDALSEWFVNHFDRNDKSEALKSILAISSQEDFESFVLSKRKDETMHDDDTSLLIARIEPDVVTNSISECQGDDQAASGNSESKIEENNEGADDTDKTETTSNDISKPTQSKKHRPCRKKLRRKVEQLRCKEERKRRKKERKRRKVKKVLSPKKVDKDNNGNKTEDS